MHKLLRLRGNAPPSSSRAWVRESSAITPFHTKLGFVLKALSLSRGRLAAEMAISKSLVSRWVSGTNTPAPYNLETLTALIAQRREGFTLLHWDKSLSDLGALFGVAEPGVAPRSAEDAPALSPLDAARLLSRREVTLEGGAYPGIYVGFRQSMGNTGRVIADLMIIWRSGDQLFYRMSDLIFSIQGEVQILDHSLFFQGAGEGRVEALLYHVIHGVQGHKAFRLDGLVMALRPDRFRTPVATSIVLQRVEDLAMPDQPPSQEQITPITERLRALYDADQITAIAGPAVIRAITSRRDDDHILRSPAERSLAASELEWSDELEADLRRLRRAVLDRDDLYPIFAASEPRTLPTSPA